MTDPTPPRPSERPRHTALGGGHRDNPADRDHDDSGRGPRRRNHDSTSINVGGRLAGRYRIRALLGQGGMSQVYLADDDDLDRPVAIKVLHRAENPHDTDHADGFIDSDEAGRLRDEARAAAAIDHPDVVEVHDVGVTATDVYVVMAYVEGESLARRIDRTGPLPAPLVATIGRAVCDALAAAHRARVVHRDVSPANIILRPDGGVTLTDFGIARRGAGAGRTQTGHVIGTPAYLAPEQARGEAVDGRTDLYSLGCCLFAALTGRPPFTHPDPFTVVVAHLREPPPRPSALQPAIPAELDDSVLRALAKDPAHRFRDAESMAAALARTDTPTSTHELPELSELSELPDGPPPRSLTPLGQGPPLRNEHRAGGSGAPAVEQTLTEIDDHHDADTGHLRLRVTVIVTTALTALTALAILAVLVLL